MQTNDSKYDFNSAGRSHKVRETGNPYHEFAQVLFKDLGEAPKEVRDSGVIERYGKDKEFWYRFHADTPASAAYGSWKDQDKRTWCAKSEADLTPAERTVYHARITASRKLADETRAKARAETAIKAREVWEKSEPLTAHPYLTAKKIQACGARLIQGKIIVPGSNFDGQITTYQSIQADGTKRFLTDGEIKGSFFSIPGNDTVGIAEGFATAASVNEAMGWTMLVAFNAGNLVTVAQAFRQRYPQAKLMICGDEDIREEGDSTPNTGRIAADKAAALTGGKLLMPELGEKKADWNDVAAARGIEEVKRQIGAVVTTYKVDLDDWDAEAMYEDTEPKPVEWLVDGVLPLATNVVLAAEGGCGKGYMTLDLAMRVAGAPAPTWGYSVEEHGAFGNRICKHGPVVIITAEDDKEEMHRRYKAVGRKLEHKVYIVPLPNINESVSFFQKTPTGTIATQWWRDFSEQIVAKKPVLVIIDPMAAFVQDDINKDPAVGQWVHLQLRKLATSSGACVLINHHMSKTKEEVTSRVMARGLVRGTSAIVDGARGCYVLWQVSDREGSTLCKLLGITFSPGKIVKGCLVKNNFWGDSDIKTYIRSEKGVLVPSDAKIEIATKNDVPAMLEVLVLAVAAAATAGHPFQHTGRQGLYERREQLPQALRTLSKRDCETFGRKLLNEGRIVKCAPATGGKSKNWLDVPDGPFAKAEGVLLPGHYEAV